VMVTTNVGPNMTVSVSTSSVTGVNLAFTGIDATHAVSSIDAITLCKVIK
jgi:hypothetical protein